MVYAGRHEVRRDVRAPAEVVRRAVHRPVSVPRHGDQRRAEPVRQAIRHHQPARRLPTTRLRQGASIEITETGVGLGRRCLSSAVSPADGHLTTPTVAALTGLCENFRPTASKS